jgi:nitrogen fixation NifU-like protein
MHCSVLAEEAIHKAINDYRISQGQEPWEMKAHSEDIHDHVHGQE